MKLEKGTGRMLDKSMLLFLWIVTLGGLTVVGQSRAVAASADGQTSSDAATQPSVTPPAELIDRLRAEYQRDLLSPR
jgi:hypothetical protein